MQIIIVKIDESFEFEKYLSFFNHDSQNKIMSYKFRIDQIRSFTSEFLKYYYLAEYLNISLSEVEIATTALGKPYVVNQNNFDFSIAHSGEYVVLAYANNAKIGVDIEKIDSTIGVASLGQEVFSLTENQLIDADYDKFFLLWSKKEALFKAHGTGFINDYYNKTSLNLDMLESNYEYTIASQKCADNYYLSICVINL